MFGKLVSRTLIIAALVGGSGSGGWHQVFAAEVAPPMLDIAGQCGAASRRNATAMSECVVAESEARAEILQNWAKYSDADADKCIKVGRKAKRLPYSAMAKCLSVDPVAAAHAARQAAPGR